jgi:hypothetical protein
MKITVLLIVLFTTHLFCNNLFSQNLSINVITRDAGVVKKGGVIFFDAAINNTDPAALAGVYKLKVQVSIADSSVVAIKSTGHNLPTGWQIISNTGTVITLSNGKDIIAPNDARTLLIALEGKNAGGPVNISGQLSFSDGIAPGTAPGSMNGDNPSDNFSASTCTVIH